LWATLLCAAIAVSASGTVEPAPIRQDAEDEGVIEEMIETVRSKDGTQISFIRIGTGSPLVLVHGSTSDHTRFARVLDALSKRFTVYAMDRRGRGGSGDSANYAPEREFEDIAAVIAAVGEPVFLLGHSFGGICALEATLRIEGVSKLILYEPPVGAPSAGRAEEYEQLLAAGRDEEMLEIFLRENVRLPEAEMEALRQLPTWPARVAAAHTVPREMRVAETYQPDAARLASLRVPTLLLLGGDSPLFQQEATERLHLAIPASRLVILPGQQHSAMMTAPDLFVREVVAFLDE